MQRAIATGEYYHIYNRSNDKKPIFLDERDWIRLLFLVLCFQSTLTFNNIGRQVSYFVKRRRFNILGDIEEIVRKRTVELISFTLMPNHFHLLIHQLKDNGIANYLSRIQNAQTKYFNTKYKRTGHLFQGSYKSVHIKSNNQLLYLSAYMHKNQRELMGWKNKEHLYPWSSYQDYLQNRWGELLKPGIILEQFNNPKDYKNFIKKSNAKEQLLDGLLIDC